jgi:arylsulfatase
VITNKGKFNRQPIHFVDIMATVSNITGASYPASFNGERIIPLQGESLLPALQGRVLPERDKPIFFEFRSGGAVRDGKWKLVTRSVSKNPFKGKITWELYDMSTDMTETRDIAKENAEVVQRLSQLWQNWYAESYGL